MCLAVPARIVSINGDMATINLGGVSREASLSLTPEARVGDYVLLHAGFAIQTLDEAEAQETLDLFAQMLAEEPAQGV
jgi:hydrogenase expression/formation protein HypC